MCVVQVVHVLVIRAVEYGVCTELLIRWEMMIMDYDSLCAEDYFFLPVFHKLFQVLLQPCTAAFQMDHADKG